MNEPTALTTAQAALTNGWPSPRRGPSRPTIGMTATFETPEYVIGDTGFANSALVMAGEWWQLQLCLSIEKNDGGGFSAWPEADGANLGTA